MFLYASMSFIIHALKLTQVAEENLASIHFSITLAMESKNKAQGDAEILIT